MKASEALILSQLGHANKIIRMIEAKCKNGGTMIQYDGKLCESTKGSLLKKGYVITEDKLYASNIRRAIGVKTTIDWSNPTV